MLSDHLKIENKKLRISDFLYNKISPGLNQANFPEIPLHKKLQLVRRLYLAITYNVRETNQVFNPMNLIYHLLTGAMLIFNLYTLIIEYGNGNYNYTYAALMSLTGCLITLFSLWLFADSLMAKVSQFFYCFQGKFNFLFNFLGYENTIVLIFLSNIEVG